MFNTPLLRKLSIALSLFGAMVFMPGAARAQAPAAEDPASFVQFVEEPADRCVSREGVQIQVKSTHPTRRIRVWLDRTYGGRGTGDRSRSDLAPGAEPEVLGCSRNQGLPQGWQLVRAVFVD